jgi:nitrous oxidase accessory protein NosD
MHGAAVLVALAAVLKPSTAILVTRGSPCEAKCGNVLDATHNDDLVCNEGDYASTSAGAVFQGCTRCEMMSNFTAGGQTDLQWMACE